MKRFWLGWWLGWVVVLLSWQAVQAQEKTFYWQRYDVNLAVQANGDILVEEIQQIIFTNGQFKSGFATIPLDRVERITEVTVAEIIAGVERPYTPQSSDPYGFVTTTSNGQLEIKWFFPPTQSSEHTYILRYRVIGGVWIYEAGDQLWWKAVPPEHIFPVQAARVAVTLPGDLAPEQLVIASYGMPATHTVAEGRVVFTAEEIPANQELEVRVQFPHGLVLSPRPAWQLRAEAQESWRFLSSFVGGGLAIILLMGGSIGVYLLWRRQKLVAAVPVKSIRGPAALTEPPSDLPPGMVGVLVDEKFDRKEIVASLIDLARRGALRLEETPQRQTGSKLEREFIFYQEDPSWATLPFEQKLLESLFRLSRETYLSDLYQRLHYSMPYLEDKLDEDLVQAGLFNPKMQTTASNWFMLGCTGLILSLLIIWGSLAWWADSFGWAFWPGLALLSGVVGLFWISMRVPPRPRRTLLGAEAAAQWRAFQRYLKTLSEEGDLAVVKDKFETFLPYAVVFGLERKLIDQFAAIDTPAPGWWCAPASAPSTPEDKRLDRTGTTRPGEPQAGGPVETPAGEVSNLPTLNEISQSLGASLTDTSRSLGTSLAQMSESLGVMLTSASRALTSDPIRHSGGSGGGGGSRSWDSSSSDRTSSSWSGGSSSGGKGGGGGSRGFD